MTRGANARRAIFRSSVPSPSPSGRLEREGRMYRKRLAAFILTGCLLTSTGCTTPSSGSGLFGLGLFSNCCRHGSSSGGTAMAAPAPVSGSAYMGGVHCPCSHQGGGESIYHPAVMSSGVSAPVSGGMVMGDMAPPPSFPGHVVNPQFPVTTQGVPPGQTFIPGSVPGSAPSTPPRIQPVPQAPPGFTPSGAVMPPSAPPQTWVPPH
jgi:hypothetical protein